MFINYYLDKVKNRGFDAVARPGEENGGTSIYLLLSTKAKIKKQ